MPLAITTTYKNPTATLPARMVAKQGNHKITLSITHLDAKDYHLKAAKEMLWWRELHGHEQCGVWKGSWLTPGVMVWVPEDSSYIVSALRPESLTK